MAKPNPDKDLHCYQNGGPNLPEAYLRLAKNKLADGDFAQSYLFAKKAKNTIIMAECLIVMGKFAEAKTHAKNLLEKTPKDRQTHLILGRALMGMKDYKGAVISFKAALALGVCDGEVVIDLGMALEAGGDLSGAIAQFDRAKMDHPDLFEILMDKADFLFHAFQNKTARQVLQKAEKIAMKDARAYYEMGLAHFIMGFANEAEKLFLTSIRLRPMLEAYRDLAACYEKSNNLKKAEVFARGALQMAGTEPSMNLILAHVERRTGRDDEALKRYQKIVDEAEFAPLRIEALNQIGRILDKQGEVDKAYKNFVEAMDLLKQDENFDIFDLSTQHQNIQTLTGWDWRKKSAKNTLIEEGFRPKQLVFFIGFPRSGTTLVQEILAGHKDVVVTPEERILRKVVDVLEDFEGNYDDVLANLTQGQIDDLRSLYFYQASTCARYDESTTLIDKLPLNLTKLPLILTLFPEAKIIFALRHPNACTLSCLMQNFSLNHAMANMVGMDEITKFYALLMGMWKKITAERIIPFHYIRYEKVVQDMAGEAKKLTEFLEIEWVPEMLDYTKTAHAKGLIRTPSYHQVIQPVYTESVEKWRGYDKYLAPYQDRLDPFCKLFGYSG